MHAEVFRDWIVTAARVIEEQRDHLTQLDAAIGDADHGINLDRGFTAVLSAMEAAAPATPGAVLTLTGSTLISKVGGASGPLYGTAFRRAGKALGDAANVDMPGLAAALEAVRAVGELPRAADGAPTRLGLALHLGAVLYGNIGAGNRLDFTCIGPAVNLAARLEKLAGRLGRSIITSREFAESCDAAPVPLGEFALPGVVEPQAAFGWSG